MYTQKVMWFWLSKKYLKGGTNNLSKLNLKGKKYSGTQNDTNKHSKKWKLGEMERMTINGKRKKNLEKGHGLCKMYCHH